MSMLKDYDGVIIDSPHAQTIFSFCFMALMTQKQFNHMHQPG